MITTQQLEAFWERYQREGVPNDLSMQAFCSMHNVPYNCFERHVRKRSKFKNIQPVFITDIFLFVTARTAATHPATVHIR